MEFEIRPEYPGQIPEVEARIQATGAEFRGMIKEVLREAAETGRKVAEAGAPRGPILERNDGGRISDSIQISDVNYRPGGAGGGGFYTIRLFASSAIAPHLKYVFEGTADQGAAKIYPARGNVLVLDKGGEGRKFVKWVHGQRAQTGWWEDAHIAVEGEIEAGVRGMNLGRL